MRRKTGIWQITVAGGERVKAFVPSPLPPSNPALALSTRLLRLRELADVALGRLAIAGRMVPDPNWFLYGFVRKEALISSQIEGTEATLQDVMEYEATDRAHNPEDVEEVCNYVVALMWARREMRSATGLPLSTRLLCSAHARLMRGVRGTNRDPGGIRRSQNWIGGTRPGNARFVPPPANEVPGALSALEKWIHTNDPLPPLVRAGLAHVQFETIHPFLDGNGRIGRLLITLLLEHWGVLPSPLLYLSLALKRRQQSYYERLSAVRTHGDWEGWTAFFLECAAEAANDGTAVAGRLFSLINENRQRLLNHRGITVPAIRLFDKLPSQPVVTLQTVMQSLRTTKPTAAKAIMLLVKHGVLREITGKSRDRVYSFHGYLRILTKENGEKTRHSWEF